MESRLVRCGGAAAGRLLVRQQPAGDVIVEASAVSSEQERARR
jgi:hypothetical protein